MALTLTIIIGSILTLLPLVVGAVSKINEIKEDKKSETKYMEAEKKRIYNMHNSSVDSFLKNKM